MYINYLKIPYKHLGRDFSGCDCFGLIILYYKNELGVELPDYIEYNKNWYLNDAKLILKKYKEFGFVKVKDIKINDILVLLDNEIPKHLGLVISNEYMLHTVEQGTACHSYRQGNWVNKIHSVYRREVCLVN